MRTLKLLVLPAAGLLLWAGGAVALDAPHDGSFPAGIVSCDSCHTLHSSPGGTLTKYPSNNYGCINCHGTGVGDNSPFAGTSDWLTGREASTATPGTGDSHNWSALPTGAGAQPPQNADMAKYVPNATTTLQCAACHDLHGKRDATQSIQKTLAPNSLHASYKYDTVYTSAGMTLMLRKPSAGANPKGYRIRTTSTTQFEISHNFDTATPTWNGPYAISTTADVNLDDGTLVKVRFGGTPAAGSVWTFYLSYPFLRTDNTLDQMCLDCHRDRVMNHNCVRGETCTADGSKYFSHPVGEALRTNDGTSNHDYDLAAPLDADGTAQYQASEANPSNALNLVGGNVSCTTCHAPHNADSNSISVDAR